MPVTIGLAGSDLTYRLHARVFCSRMGSEVRNTSALAPFLSELASFGYDPCDQPC